MNQKTMNRYAVSFFLLLIMTLVTTQSQAGRAVQPASLHGLDAKLGVRFLSPLTAGMAPGTQVDALVTSPEKLLELGLGTVKRGDRVTLIKGAQGDDFSVKLGSQTAPMTLNPAGSVKSIILQGGRNNSPAAGGANSIILEGGKAPKGQLR